MVGDNKLQFTSEALTTLIKLIGCHSVCTHPRHPRSNGLAECFVKTLKTAIHAQASQTYCSKQSILDSFLIQFRNAAHASTGKTPSFLLHSMNIRTTANLDTMPKSHFIMGTIIDQFAAFF